MHLDHLEQCFRPIHAIDAELVEHLDCNGRNTVSAQCGPVWMKTHTPMSRPKHLNVWGICMCRFTLMRMPHTVCPYTSSEPAASCRGGSIHMYFLDWIYLTLFCLVNTCGRCATRLLVSSTWNAKITLHLC